MTAPKTFYTIFKMMGNWYIYKTVPSPYKDQGGSLTQEGMFPTFQEALTEYLKGEREGIPSNN